MAIHRGEGRANHPLATGSGIGLQPVIRFARAIVLFATGAIAGLVNRPEVLGQSPSADPRLTWHLVTGAPQVVAGENPTWHSPAVTAVFDLCPGESTTLLLPAHAMLRVIPVTAASTCTPLQYWYSTSDRLFQETRILGIGPDGDFLIAPRVEQPSLLRILLPGEARCGARFCLRTADGASTPPIETHGEIPIDGNCPVRLQTDWPQRTETYYRLPTGESAHLTVEGPACILCETRLHYPRTESRRHQVYHLIASLNGEPEQYTEFDTTALMHEPVCLESSCTAVGERRQAIYFVPCGRHRLQIRSDVPLLMHCAYVGPKHAQPRIPLERFAGHVIQLPSTALERHLWDLAPESIGPLARHVFDPKQPLLVPALRRLARDNMYRDGGLSAAMLLNRAPVEPFSETARLASDLRNHYTQYLDLLPHDNYLTGVGSESLHDGELDPSSIERNVASPQFCWFHVPDLQLQRPICQPMTIAKPHLDDLLRATLAGGYFVQISSTPRMFALPDRPDIPSVLKVAVDGKQNAAIYLQFDGECPCELRLDTCPSSPACEWIPSVGAGALSALRAQHTCWDAATLGGPFVARRHLAAPCLLVSAAEVTVPQNARQVRVWTDTGPSPAQISLQIRTSRTYELSETTYLQMMAGTEPCGMALWWQLMADSCDANASWELHELRNHWASTRRMLRSWQQQFSGDRSDDCSTDSIVAGVQTAIRSERLPPKMASAAAAAPPESVEPRETVVIDHLPEMLSSHEVKPLQESFQRYLDRREWLPAFEAGITLFHHGPAAQRAEVLSGVTTSLLALGEPYLAEMMLKHSLLHDPEWEIRQIAERELQKLYAQTGDRDDELMLATTVALSHELADHQALASLAERLAVQGYYTSALLVGLVLPPADRPTATIARCAFELGWWQVFDEAICQLSPAEQHRWNGLKRLYAGEDQQAAALLERADPLGQQLASHLRDATAIWSQLRSRDADQRATAIEAWERWHARHPGEHVWKREPSCILSCAGGQLVYSTQLDEYSQYYRGTTIEPVRLVAYGPGMMRIIARPIQGAAETPSTLNDGQQKAFDTGNWLEVKSTENIRHSSLLGNAPSPGLIMVGDDRQRPGQKVIADIALEPGANHFSVSATQSDLLVDVKMHRPEIPLPVLPPINPTTLAAARSGCWLPTIGGGPIGAVRVPLRITQPGCEAQQAWVSLSNSHDPCSVATAGHHCVFDCMDVTAVSETPAATTAPVMEQARQQLADLVIRAESDPTQLESSFFASHRLVSLHGHHPQLMPLFARISRRGSWNHLADVAQSAGIYEHAISGWQPESPAYRVRKAFVPPLSADDYVLTGAQQLLWDVAEDQDVEIRVTVQLLSLAYLPSSPVTVGWDFDGRPQPEISLAPGSDPATNAIRIPAGVHQVRWYLVDPQANSFVRLAIETSSAGAISPRRSPNESRRIYHVATQAEPVRLHVSGPAVLRVDELCVGTVTSRYVSVPAPSAASAASHESIELTPTSNQPRALLRIARWQPSLQRIESSPAPTCPPAAPIARLWEGMLTPTCDTGPWLTYWPMEAIKESWQQADRTWELGGSYYSRRPLEEDRARRQRDEFWQAEVGSRLFRPWWNTYSHTSLMTRWRESGEPTLAWQQELWHLPPDFRWRVHSSLTGYVQPNAVEQVVEQAVEQGAGRDTAAAAVATARVWSRTEFDRQSFHLPGVTLFGRLMSIDRDEDPIGLLDQDIFTPYKSDHRYGLHFSDTFYHQPWPDIRWWMNGSLVTNEDFNPFAPDYLSLRIGRQQQYRHLDWDLSYRYAAFLPDDDRRRHRHQHLLYWDALLRGGWGNRLWNLHARMVHDLEDGGTTINVGVIGILGGRGYRDYWPGEFRFP